MKNPFKPLTDKARELVNKVKPAPEKVPGILNGTGYTLLTGALVAMGVLAAGPATLTVAAGATAIGLMGLGFGALQEGDNAKHQLFLAARKAEEAKPVGQETNAPVLPVEPPAPVAAVKPAATEFTAAVEKKAEVVATPAVVQAPAAKAETPKAAA